MATVRFNPKPRQVFGLGDHVIVLPLAPMVRQELDGLTGVVIDGNNYSGLMLKIAFDDGRQPFQIDAEMLAHVIQQSQVRARRPRVAMRPTQAN